MIKSWNVLQKAHRILTTTILHQRPHYGNLKRTKSNTPPKNNSINISGIFMRFAQTQATTSACWNCKSSLSSSDLFCGNCNVIQKPFNTENYFHVFDIGENFDVDLKSLTLKYRRMQSFVHPDKFSNKSEDEKAISELHSALLNKAYKTLQVPLERALHMLHLRHVYIEESDKASDPAFLAEVMELNEEIEAATTPDKLKALDKKNRTTLESIAADIQMSLKKNDIGNAKNCVIKMKYYDSISQRINNLLREKGIVD